MKRRSSPSRILTLRELNRAMLARQLLLTRAKLNVVAAIERLAALQAQWSPSPYIALWSRLLGFRHERLWSAIERHQVIRARLMRGTLHLVSARDFYAYAVATQDLQRGAWNRLQIGRGVDPKEVAALAIAFARDPRRKEEVLAHVQERVAGALGGPFNWLVWRFVSARPTHRTSRRVTGSRAAGGRQGTTPSRSLSAGVSARSARSRSQTSQNSRARCRRGSGRPSSGSRPLCGRSPTSRAGPCTTFRARRVRLRTRRPRSVSSRGTTSSSSATRTATG